MTMMPTNQPNPFGSFSGFMQDPQGSMNALPANPLFQVGLGLLSAGRDRRNDPFQAASQGLLAANQVQQAQADADMRRQQFGFQKQKFDYEQQQQQKMQEARAQVQGLLAEGRTEEAARIALTSGDDSMARFGIGLLTPGRGSEMPADVRTAEWYRNATPDQRAMFDKITAKPQNPFFQSQIMADGKGNMIPLTFDARSGRYSVAPINGMPADAGPPAGNPPPPTGGNPYQPGGTPPSSSGAPGAGLIPVSLSPTLAGNKSAAEAGGAVTGKGRAEAAMDQPRLDMNADLTLGVLDSLQKHPGRQYATGFYSIAPTIPGTPQADFRTYLDQLNGQTFLQAYQSLKGGGQITEVEGKKATDAISRIKAAQTDAEFDKGIDELRGMITRAREINRKKASVPKAETPPPPAGWSIREKK